MDKDLGPIEKRLARRTRPQDQAAHDLQRIDDALGRMERGCFGYCEACGTQIDLARLTKDPAARCCASCETKTGD
ncbi:MAG: hypothetical protein GVY06_10345 [Alphaproteobacteria bacterium]|nr:hypothetical protein [Alphaproteobacteria bacterium]